MSRPQRQANAARCRRREMGLPRFQRCAATGKLSFPDWESAERQLRVLMTRNSCSERGVRYSVYPCDACGKYHYGSRFGG